jgi:hypothetical protein
VRSHDLLFPSASRHVASLLFTSSASDPNHCTLTTVTSASGGIPRTAALGWRSSRRVMFCSWPLAEWLCVNILDT